MKKYAALFCRSDSAYKKRDEWDVFDLDRNALTFKGDMPCVCHPPCRTWGIMSHMAFRNKDWSPSNNPRRKEEKKLALWCIDQVRQNGGIIEHPKSSKLFKIHLPDVGMFLDEYGGFTIEIDQFDFGHVAHKATKLYICGIAANELPKLPGKRIEFTDRSIAGNIPGTKRCTQYQREYTPELLIDFFELILDKIQTKGLICSTVNG